MLSGCEYNRSRTPLAARNDERWTYLLAYAARVIGGGGGEGDKKGGLVSSPLPPLPLPDYACYAG